MLDTYLISNYILNNQRQFCRIRYAEFSPNTGITIAFLKVVEVC